VNNPSTLKISRGQENMLKSIMKSTDNKKDYRRLLAILQKGEGRTYHDIAKEHMELAVDLYKDGSLCILRKGSSE
jgi:hypothetical protein